MTRIASALPEAAACFAQNSNEFFPPLLLPSSSSVLSATTTETAPHGSVTYLPENGEIAAEETVEIIYSPPEGMFEGAESLLYCGGFNGWDGEEDGVTMPMMPVGDEGNFRICINVPNFARVSESVVLAGTASMATRSPIICDGNLRH